MPVRTIGRAAAHSASGAALGIGTRSGARSGACSAVGAVQPLGIAGSWNLVFQDEFDTGLTPSSSLYNFFPCWGDNANPTTDAAFLQGDTQTTGRSGLAASAATVAGGSLLLTGSSASTPYGGQTFPYRSGRVRTKQSWQYGFFEARLKPAAGQGMWTTFWLMPPVYTDTAAWEIDICEFPGTGATRAYQNLHWGLFSSGLQSLSNVDADYSTAMHTYGVHWEANRVRWFIDGTLVKTYSGTAGSDISNTPMQLTCSLDMGGPSGWVNDFDGSTPLPRESEVEYIRAWQ